MRRQQQCNGIYYDCDGIIIVPLNGNREIKVKPKSKMTIDLLYKSGNWLDRENNIYNKYRTNCLQNRKRAKPHCVIVR